MDEDRRLAECFEEQRGRLRGVAYRMLGSMTEADDAVQDAWLRVSRAGASEVENVPAWLTTVVARVCLNMLRTRNRRREEFLGVHIPDPVVTADDEPQPEEEVVLADSVGLALLVVLDSLTPAERLAFVLHDMFELSFEEIAPMVDRSPVATRQLASRARRRVKGADARRPDRDVVRQRQVVDAFFRASRGGDFDALVGLLHPDVVLRADYGSFRPAASMVVEGAEAIARRARWVPDAVLHPVLVNGAAGVVVTVADRPFVLMAFTVVDGRVAEIDVIGDPERVAALAGEVIA